ncbi:dual specificity protein phosphatase 19 [Orussus abietinus]|uniref:dual specificity protein phosphatase 19 n=1 Tax=Orussus abietinus TaxID=222816 RepID=UPI000625A770|nr:dual specificity protein phosphatase 19 [Orussus abietinus]
MDLLSLINRRKASLKPCSTTVTDMQGKRYEIVNGEVKRISQGFAFVIDTKPNLQVAQILPGLYLGSQDPALSIELLTEFQIHHILSIGIDIPIKFGGIHYHYIDLLDLPECDILEALKKCIKLIHTHRTENIFVHCNAGVSRSPAIVISYLMAVEQLDYECAYERVKSTRTCIKPNEGFARQLKLLNPKDLYSYIEKLPTGN